MHACVFVKRSTDLASYKALAISTLPKFSVGTAKKAAVLIKFWLLGTISITDVGSRASDPRNLGIFGQLIIGPQESGPEHLTESQLVSFEH